MNKMDRPARDPLALLDELERVLGIAAYPVNWPLGDGQDFRGVFDRHGNVVHFFERVPGGEYRAPVSVHGLSDPLVQEAMTPQTYARTVEDLAMLDGAGAAFEHAAVLAGEPTAEFFCRPVNEFGWPPLLALLFEMAPPRGAPQPSRLSHQAPCARFSVRPY